MLYLVSVAVYHVWSLRAATSTDSKQAHMIMMISQSVFGHNHASTQFQQTAQHTPNERKLQYIIFVFVISAKFACNI